MHTPCLGARGLSALDILSYIGNLGASGSRLQTCQLNHIYAIVYTPAVAISDEAEAKVRGTDDRLTDSSVSIGCISSFGIGFLEE